MQQQDNKRVRACGATSGDLIASDSTPGDPATWRAVVVVLVAAMASGVGCYHPKLINMITASKDQIKFMYVDQGTQEQGAIRCAVAADGTLSQCTEIAFVFND